MFYILLVIIYMAFISLGLPDSLLGSAWPSMYGELGVPISFAGIISMIIAGGTITSSLFSDRLVRKLGAGKLTAVSVATTALALFGFSVSHSFWMLVLFAVPFGLGAGGVDAAINNYVALHYSSRVMSWLHCMWGVGAITGPYIMGYALTGGQGFSMGYRYVSFLQMGLTVILILSLPLWKNHVDTAQEDDTAPALSLKQVFKLKGAKEVLIAFLCYCAVEQTAMLWSASFLVLEHGMAAEVAASFASMFFIGITVGRFLNGFITVKFTDTELIRAGQAIIALGVLLMLLPWTGCAIAGIIVVGVGCAPIYPCIIHSTPAHFGAGNSQAIIGVQMAFAYMGTLCAPPLFGLIANHIDVYLLPLYLLVFTVVMAVMYQRVVQKTDG